MHMVANRIMSLEMGTLITIFALKIPPTFHHPQIILVLGVLSVVHD